MKKFFFIAVILIVLMFECVHTATNTAMRIDTVTNDENGEAFSYTIYEADNSILIRLEDLAVILNGTDNKFNVYNDKGTYVIEKNKSYTGEKSGVSDSTAERPFYAAQKTDINVDGTEKTVIKYQIEGLNYFKADEIIDAIGLNYDLDIEESTYSFKNSDNYAAAFMVTLPAYKAQDIVDKKYGELNRVDADKPMIALTFDDGPKIGSTERIVEVLKKCNGRATFFVVGQMVENHPELVKLAYDAGCQIGNHSYDHANLVKLSADGVKTEIYKTSNLVYEITGEYTMVGRPPYGSINDTVRSNISIPWFNWNVDTLDWKNRNAEYVKNYVLENADDGDVILMHDLHPTTADAMVECIPQLVEKGFQLVTMDELVKYKYNGDVTQVPGYVK